MKREKSGLTASEKRKPSATLLSKPHPIFTKNDPVRYHPVIGGPHDGKTYTIRGIGCLPGNRQVVWLIGKVGYVPLESLSHMEKGKLKR
ncbi:hypothetical protein [Desulfoluna spongiiphila]|uniref:Uncharacterized protein n=1 Tax=Desulfoluna spongiiphila TaxID=419481 RepID=A0A1G5J913_9BACT|nr:hypothetical protein [Desulfoluna spongiiphila]SCY84431.1 hypothetical protein SAMN05216233_12617 [Desulfoluna spongiiphila]